MYDAVLLAPRVDDGGAVDGHECGEAAEDAETEGCVDDPFGGGGMAFADGVAVFEGADHAAGPDGGGGLVRSGFGR